MGGVTGAVGTCQGFQGVSAHQGSSRGCHRGISLLSVSHRVSGDVRGCQGVSIQWCRNEGCHRRVTGVLQGCQHPGGVGLCHECVGEC